MGVIDSIVGTFHGRVYTILRNDILVDHTINDLEVLKTCVFAIDAQVFCLCRNEH